LGKTAGMSTPTAQPDEPRGTGFEPRTGAEQPWDPEDLAEAEGRDPTPENIERARQELEREGPAAIEKTVP
jgi:hypothetical protein